jgi:hypothetical protein
LDTWVRGLDAPWDLDRWTRVATTNAVYLYLRARDVKLSSAGAAGTVETNVLSTEQVLAWSCWESDMWLGREVFQGMLTGAARDFEAVRGDVLECDRTRANLSADLRDLEPRPGSVVAGSAAWGF